MSEAPVFARETASSSRSLMTLAVTAVVATAFGFVLRSLVIDDWGVEFGLSQTQKGELLGVGLWPFSISIVLLSFFIDRVGFRAILWLAFLCHAAATAITLLANGYWTLYLGTFLFSLGCGAVEAAANPLVATIHAENKTKWLNVLHSGWPLGQVLGGLLALGMGPAVDWRWKVALVAFPVVAYGALIVGRRFPDTERVTAGVSYRDMLREAGVPVFFIVATLITLEIGRTFDLSLLTQVFVIAAATVAAALAIRSVGRPLYLIFLLLMIPLATTELGTDSWITALMTEPMSDIGLQAGWVIVFTAMITWILRLSAGPFIHRWSALGLLAGSAAITAMGLVALSAAPATWILAAAALFGLGKAFLWATSLGVVAEQFPRGGALTLNFTAGVGMLAAGIVGSTALGAIQDRSIETGLRQRDQVTRTRTADDLLSAPHRGVLGTRRGLDDSRLAASDPATQAEVKPIVDAAKRDVLRWVAILPLGMCVAYTLLLFWYRRRGGYRPVEIIAPGLTGVADPPGGTGR